MTEIEHYRDLAEFDHLVSAKPGMFWCYTHLLDMSLTDQSPDPCYCRGCFDVLMTEYRELVKARGKRRPWWVPGVVGDGKTVPQVVEHGAVIMSTLDSKEIKMDIIPPAPPVRRGPKKKVLPMKLVAQLAGQGLGSKAIAFRLNADGIAVSYRTIQRQL